MTNITYKRVGKNDLDLILRIDDAIFDNPVILAQAKAFLASDLHTMFVALDGSGVVGMASSVTMLHPDKQPMVFVQEVGVHDDYLRQGIGKTLITHLLDYARSDRDTDVWLATEQNNTPARALYRSMNARETSGIVVYDWGHAMDDD